MGAESQRILDDYRKARDENDWVKQASILTALLGMLLDADDEPESVARDTAREVLRLREVTA